MTSTYHQASQSQVCLILRAACWPAETGPRNPQASYYRARYYDPASGKFLAEDPTGFRSGEDFYVYAFGNPLLWSDPTGLQPQKNCAKKPCAVSVSCLPARGTSFSHCSVTTQDGFVYTTYDGSPSGSIWWSKLIITKGPGTPPGPNTIFTKNVDCKDLGKLQRVAEQNAPNNKANHDVYNFFLQNSNTAAMALTEAAGVYPDWPWSAWGAYP